MLSRRNFLVGAATGACSIKPKFGAIRTASSPFPFDEWNTNRAPRFPGINQVKKKVFLPTPVHGVWIRPLPSHTQAHGRDRQGKRHQSLRPHVKGTRSVSCETSDIAHGAIGLTGATIAESELFSEPVCKGVLWTKQPRASNTSIWFFVALFQTGSHLYVRCGRSLVG